MKKRPLSEHTSVKKRKKKARFICGTPAGYIRHLRRHERPCKHCLVGSETYSEDEIRDLVGDFQKWSSAQHLWKTYQLSHDRFEQIFAEQDRRCACCLSTDPGESHWRIDHDQRTRLIRGILCARCSTGITQLGDELQGLQQAVVYLQAHQARGGHKKAETPPSPHHPLPKISAIMRQCFDLFKQGVPCNKVIILLKLTPATASEIYAQWTARGGEIEHVSRHIFQIPKDPPQRIMCSCGYAVPWEDPDGMSNAVNLVNAHIEGA